MGWKNYPNFWDFCTFLRLLYIYDTSESTRLMAVSLGFFYKLDFNQFSDIMDHWKNIFFDNCFCSISIQFNVKKNLYFKILLSYDYMNILSDFSWVQMLFRDTTNVVCPMPSAPEVFPISICWQLSNIIFMALSNGSFQYYEITLKLLYKTMTSAEDNAGMLQLCIIIIAVKHLLRSLYRPMTGPGIISKYNPKNGPYFSNWFLLAQIIILFHQKGKTGYQNAIFRCQEFWGTSTCLGWLSESNMQSRVLLSLLIP